MTTGAKDKKQGMTQVQLLVSWTIQGRASALALASDTRRAEVFRAAREGDGLRALEGDHTEALTSLDATARRMGFAGRLELANRAIEDRLTLADIEGCKRYPNAVAKPDGARAETLRKFQTQLLVQNTTRDRADALALVRNDSRAEVLRFALECGGLRSLEGDHTEALTSLDALAKGMGFPSGPELAARAALDKWKLTDLEGRKRYPRR